MDIPVRNVNERDRGVGECFAIVLFVHARMRLVSVLIAAGHTAAGMLYFIAVFIFPTRASSFGNSPSGTCPQVYGKFELENCI